jgi:hypothetical protein
VTGTTAHRSTHMRMATVETRPGDAMPVIVKDRRHRPALVVARALAVAFLPPHIAPLNPNSMSYPSASPDGSKHLPEPRERSLPYVNAVDDPVGPRGIPALLPTTDTSIPAILPCGTKFHVLVIPP